MEKKKYKNKLNNSLDNQILNRIINLDKLYLLNNRRCNLDKAKKLPILNKNINENNKYIKNFNEIMNTKEKEIKKILPKSFENSFYKNPNVFKLKYLKNNFLKFYNNIKKIEKNDKNISNKKLKKTKIFKSVKINNNKLNKSWDIRRENFNFKVNWAKNHYNNYYIFNSNRLIKNKYFILSKKINKIILKKLKIIFKFLKNHKQIDLKNLTNYKINMISKFLKDFNVNIDDNIKSKLVIKQNKTNNLNINTIDETHNHSTNEDGDEGYSCKQFNTQISTTIKLKYNNKKIKNCEIKNLYSDIIILKKNFIPKNTVKKNINNKLFKNDLNLFFNKIKKTYIVVNNYDKNSIFPNFYFYNKNTKENKEVKYSSYWMVVVKNLLKKKNIYKDNYNIGYYSLFNFHFNRVYLRFYIDEIKFKNLYKIIKEKEDYYHVLNKFNCFHNDYNDFNLKCLVEFYFFWNIKYSINYY